MATARTSPLTSRGMVFLSPGRCCWNCERVLPLTPKAVLIVRPDSQGGSGKAPTRTDGWVLTFTCNKADCASEVASQMQSIGLDASTVTYIDALVLIHTADELEVTEGWERATLNRRRDIKLDASLRAITEALGMDRPWLVSCTGAAAWEKLASLGMGTKGGGSSCAS